MKKQCIALGMFALLGTGVFAQYQNMPYKVRKTYSIDSRLSSTDYKEKTIIFKLKPEFRHLGGQGNINDVKMQQAFNYLGIAQLFKKYPNHKSPEKQLNRLGQTYADLSLLYELSYSNNIELEAAINLILSSNIVSYAEPKFIYKPEFTPNDPDYAAQQGASTKYMSRIRAALAWDINQGDTTTVIAIVDSGTDTDHPDLVGNFKRNYADPVNGIDDDNDGFIDNNLGWDLGGADYNNVVGDNNTNITGSNNNHGSHVSGCASATTNNSVGVAGTGFKCRLLPVKCSADNDTRASGSGYIIEGYEGIVYAADHGAQIINCSWGGPGFSSAGQDVINYATVNKNCLVIASAGNSGVDEENYPASYDYVLSVAATNSNTDGRATFSTYNYTVDISTPGNNIYATLYNNSYGSMSGTSMSAPITAGGAGLVYSHYHYTNLLQVGQRLKQTADYHYASGPNITGSVAANAVLVNKLGSGRMNLQRALSDNVAPSVVFSNEMVSDHNDAAFVVGDTLYIKGMFTNYLTACTNLTASIKDVTSPVYTSVIDSTFTIGALGTLDTISNYNDLFRFKLNTGIPMNQVITFRVLLKDGTYSEKYFFTVTVNVDYVNIAINDVATTITSKGKIGYNADSQAEGLGFKYMGENLMYEGSFMVGSSSTAVSDAFRGSTAGSSDADFSTMTRAYQVVPSVVSEFDVKGRFSDAPASPSQNLQISHSAHAWTSNGHRKYVIVEYKIKNNGTSQINNVFAGIAADWDIDASTASANKSDFDSGRKLGYVYSTAAAGLYAGVQVLSSTAPPVFYSVDNESGGNGGIDVNDQTDYFGTGDKYTALSTNRYQGGTNSTTGKDVITVTSSGPLAINAGDSVTVAFALLAGDDLADIQESADSAASQYSHFPNAIKQELQPIASQFKTYPNPVNQQFQIEFTPENSREAISIEINNILGQTVYTQQLEQVIQGSNKVTISTAGLKAGTYVLKLHQTGKQSITQKLMIQH